MSPMRWRRPAAHADNVRHVSTPCLIASDWAIWRNRPAQNLPGGDQRRPALARALARDPEILLLDEPTASLDPAATRGVEEIIGMAAQSGIKIVMASHDLGQVRRLAGDVIFLVRGALCEQGPAADFLDSPSTPEAAAFVRGDLVI